MENSIKFMIIIAFVVGLVLYFEIQRLTRNIDKIQSSPENFYKTFYKELKNCLSLLLDLQNDYLLKIPREEFEEKVEELEKDIEYAELLNSNRSTEIQDEGIFKILSKMDALAYESFDEADKIVEVYKNNLEELYSRRGF